MKNKKIIFIIIFIIQIIILPITFNLSVFADEENDDYDNYSEEYKNYLKLSDEEKEKIEVIPEKYDLSVEEFWENYEDTGIDYVGAYDVATSSNTVFKTVAASASSSNSTISAIPSSYNLSTNRGIKINVENQGQQGLCWAFASLGALRTHLAVKDSTFNKVTPDLSEWHVNYLTSKYYSKGSGRELGSGGNFNYALKYFKYNDGAIKESTLPYETKITPTTAELKKLDSMKPYIYVHKTIKFPSITKKRQSNGTVKIYNGSTEITKSEMTTIRNSIKKHIMNYGGLYCSIRTNSNFIGNNLGAPYNTYSGRFSQYDDGSIDSKNCGGHAITIVGWDDNYSRNNFYAKNSQGKIVHPSSNGAYLILNSYGDKSFENGYQWVSYEDYGVERALFGYISANTMPNTYTYQFKTKEVYEKMKKLFSDKEGEVKVVDDLKLIIVPDILVNEITTLDLSSSNLTDSDIETIFKYKFPKVKYIYMSKNKLTKIPKMDCPSLEKLYASENEIENIDNLQYLRSSLKDLYLTENKIKDVGVLSVLVNLKKIYISHNNIENTTPMKLANYEKIGLINQSISKTLTNTLTCQYPNIFTAAKNSKSKIYSSDGLEFINCEELPNGSGIKVTNPNAKSIYVKIKSGEARLTKMAITVKDTVIPTLTVTGRPTSTVKDFTIQIKASDACSGIASLLVNSKSQKLVDGVCEYKITENGKYTIIAKDKAGNQTQKEIVINEIDNISPTLSSINIESPVSGKYKTGDVIKIVSTYSEDIYGTSSGATIKSSTAPILKIKFGTGQDKTASFSESSGKTITYTYKIQDGDNGVLSTSEYSGTVYDKVGNKLDVKNKTIGGNKITADTTSPTCQITATVENATNANTITYRFTWSEELAKNTFTADDITVTNGTKGKFEEVTANKVYTLVVTNNESCIQKVAVVAGKCTDEVGNNNTASSKEVTIDRKVPKCTITASTKDTTNANSITYTFTWSEELAKNTFTLDDIVVTKGVKGEFKETTPNKVFTLVVTNSESCIQKVQIAEGKCIDLVGNKNEAVSKGITIDRSAPTCTITANTENTTNAKSIEYTFTWSEKLANNTFTADDIVVTNGTKGTFKATTANKVYKLVVTNTGNCTQKVEIAAGKCTDEVGNLNKATSKTIKIDRTAPTCKITANKTDTTNASSITYTFTWSEELAKNTFTADDIVVTNGTKGIFKATTANKVYTLVVTNSGNCIQKVEVAAGKCTDAVGNNNTAVSKTITINRTAPACIITASEKDKTNAGSITYTFTWNKTLAKNTFTADDIKINKGNKGTFKEEKANKVYTLVVTNTGSCTQKVEIEAGICMDEVGNKNTAVSKEIVIDRTEPACTITASEKDTTSASSIIYTFTWNEVLANNTFAANDIVVTNGTKGTFKTVTPNKVYTLVVTNSGSCTQKVEVKAKKCTDEVGNTNKAASKKITINRTAPTCTITANEKDKTNAESIKYTFTWNKTLAKDTFTMDDITVTNGEKGEFKEVTKNKEYTLVVTNTGSCTQKVEIAAKKCTDEVGNNNTAASKEITIDRTSPTCKITTNTGNTTNVNSITYTFTWSEILANNTFSSGDITVIQGTKGTFKTVTPNKVYTLVVTNTGNCTQKVQIAEGKCTDEVGNKNKAASKAITINRMAPTLEVTGNSENWTNKDITLTIKVQENKSKLKNLTVNNEKIEVENGQGTYKVTENGTYEIVVTDETGNTAIDTEIVDKIDKQSPKLEVTGNPTTWSKEAILKIVANDDLSGIKNVTINGKEISLKNGQVSCKLTKNGTYDIIIVDNAENKVQKEIVVDKIRRKADVNENEKIDSNDLLKVMQHIASQRTGKNKEKWLLTGEKEYIADINQDGKIDQRDILQLKRYLAASRSEEIAKKHKDWLDI